MSEAHEAGAPAGAEAHEATRAAVIAAGGTMTSDHDAHDGHDDAGSLGPLDAQAWGAGILGVASGGIVAVLLYLAAYH